MELNIHNLDVVVTGGAGALGSQTVNRFLAEGAVCHIPVFERKSAVDLPYANEDRAHITYEVDLADEDQAAFFFDQVKADSGRLWASVHIAGGFGMGDIVDTPLADFMKQLKMNAVTCYNSCRAAARIMKARGEGGRIVNIASRPALDPWQGAGMSTYTASKSAVAALTQSLAAELREDDIWVNAVAPSVIDTPANRKAMSSADFDKWVKPETLAREILWLAAPENNATTGAVLPVYGKS